jgi:hypothetical protein
MHFIRVLLLLILSSEAFCYSVLSHEAIVDAAWDSSIQPFLLKKFPSSTADELKKSRAYAYGGAIMPDMGYYPFGSRFFTNLVHYSRTGDFVENLISESENVNELAFALGALAHYHADKCGHSEAVNTSVPRIFPKLRKRFGEKITYDQHHLAHKRTEFSFDVTQLVLQNYAPENFHDYIGFQVAQNVLERAFEKTYDLKLKDVFVNLPLAIYSFRWTVKNLFPALTKAAWVMNKEEIIKKNPGVTARKYQYKLPGRKFRSEWQYEKTGKFGNRLMVGVLTVATKTRLIRSVKVKAPDAKSQEEFIKSFKHTVEMLNTDISMLASNEHHLDNYNFDTGRKSHFGEYILADQCYRKLSLKVFDKKDLPDDVRNNIVQFYKDHTPIKDRKLNQALVKLSSK